MERWRLKRRTGTGRKDAREADGEEKKHGEEAPERQRSIAMSASLQLELAEEPDELVCDGVRVR
jgi:hypothetical protein